MPNKPILCLDFDGVIHSYTSGWKGATVISDPIVPGTLEFLREAVHVFRVMVYSSRSHEPGGVEAMMYWLENQAHMALPHEDTTWLAAIEFPKHKPAAFLTIDDRAITFTGSWLHPESLLTFKPWWAKA